MVVLKINGEVEPGRELAAIYGVRGFPSFVVANSEAEPIRTWIGYSRPETFVAHLREAIDDPIPIRLRIARLEQAPTERDAVIVATYHLQRLEARQAEDAFRLARECSGRKAGAYALEIFRARTLGLYNHETSAEELVALASETLDAADLDIAERLSIGTACLDAATRENHREVATPIIERVLETISATDLDEAASRQYQTLSIAKAMLIDKDPGRALAMRRQALGVGWEDSPTQLNDFAWWCFVNRINLEQAERLARRGAELTTDPALRAVILDTLAEICYARGNRKQAMAAIREAITEDPDNPYYREQLVRFGG